MNIWIFAHYASIPSLGQYTGHYDLAKELVANGHHVTIFASSFSHYTFRETVLADGQTSCEAAHDGVRFVWLRTPPYRANDWRRVINMVVYAVRATTAALRRSSRPDVCVGVCVHPFAGLSAWLVARLCRASFVYEIRDLWPLVLIETGRIRASGLPARLLFALERFLVRRARCVIAAWRYVDRYLAERGCPPRRIVWIPQFADLQRIPADSGSPDEHGDFVVMYTGGHVHTMGLDIVLRAAKVLQDRGAADVRFVLVGSGQEKPALVALAHDLELKNVEFREPVPKARLYSVMREADAYIVSLRSLPSHQYGISINKLCDYFAMRRPVVYAASSSYNPVVDAGAGFGVPPESPEAIAEAVLRLKALTPSQRALMGERGWEHLLKNHEKGLLVARFEQTLRAVCAESPAS
jgi:glycosyltransferase involved in cell wall biosynthesis